MTNDLIFIEPYHFGTNGRASGKVPVIELHKGGKFYDQFEGHFKFIWDISESYTIDDKLVDFIKNPDKEYLTKFHDCMKFLRPDLVEKSA